MLSRRMTAEITMIRRKTIAVECDILKEIQKNNIREKEII